MQIWFCTKPALGFQANTNCYHSESMYDCGCIRELINAAFIGRIPRFGRHEDFDASVLINGFHLCNFCQGEMICLIAIGLSRFIKEILQSHCQKLKEQKGQSTTL